MVIQPLIKARDTKRIENFLSEYISQTFKEVLDYYPVRYYSKLNHIFPKMSTRPISTLLSLQI